MTLTMSDRKRAFLAGSGILLAYLMLTYTLTGSVMLGFFTDTISGLAVIATAVLLFPLLARPPTRILALVYVAARLGEGLLMILGGLLLLDPPLAGYRATIYEYIHIHFFILGALLLYGLLYQSRIVPRFISVWGFLAALALALVAALDLSGVQSPLLGALVIPIVLNEILLALWLMIRGVTTPA